MTRVSIKELSDHTSEIARRVREDHETIELTYHGEIIGQIVPKRAAPSDELPEQIWPERMQLIRDIARHRRDDISAVDTVREIRRDL